MDDPTEANACISCDVVDRILYSQSGYMNVTWGTTTATGNDVKDVLASDDIMNFMSAPLRSTVNDILQTVTLAIMWLGALTGNVLVCLVIYKSRRLQSTTNYFVVSLAGADLCYGVFVMPFILSDIFARKWVAGAAICKMVRYVQLLVPLTMVSVLISICVDRYYTIIYPLSFKVTRSTAKRMILTSWIVALVFASPAWYLYDVMQYSDGTSYCKMVLHTKWESLYSVFLAIFSYFVPIIGISIGYTKIFRFIWRSGVGGRTFQRTTNAVPRSKVKMIKLIIVVNLIVIALLAPWYIMHLYFSTQYSDYYVNPTVYIAVVWIFFSNAVAKPVLYLCYNSNFRRGCKEVLCMSSMKCYRSNAYTITSTSKFGKRNHIGIVETSIYGEENRRVESPTKTFDRTTMVEKIAWPIAAQAPSTYL